MSQEPGLSCGRNWGAVPLRHEQHEWTMDTEGPLVQGPVDLSDFQGQRMLLHLESGQFALLLTEQTLKVVYLDGSHHLDIGSRPDQVHVQNRLVLINTERSLDYRWAQGFVSHEGEAMIGRCSIRIAKPAKFYHSVLSQQPSWTPDSIHDIVEPLVHQAFKDLIDQVVEHACDHSGGLQSALMALGAHQLDEFLSAHGLFCEAIAAYTAAPPVEECSDETAGQSADLLHN